MQKTPCDDISLINGTFVLTRILSARTSWEIWSSSLRTHTHISRDYEVPQRTWPLGPKTEDGFLLNRGSCSVILTGHPWSQLESNLNLESAIYHVVDTWECSGSLWVPSFLFQKKWEQTQLIGLQKSTAWLSGSPKPGPSPTGAPWFLAQASLAKNLKGGQCLHPSEPSLMARLFQSISADEQNGTSPGDCATHGFLSHLHFGARHSSSLPAKGQQDTTHQYIWDPGWL